MIDGIGIDVVDIARFQESLERTPSLREKLFTESERDKPVQSLAARFAAKEAVIKALAGSPEIEWHGIEVGKESSGKPVIWLHGQTAKLALQLGVRKFHVSISHDGDNAVAFVVAEGELA